MINFNNFNFLNNKSLKPNSEKIFKDNIEYNDVKQGKRK